MTTQGAWDHFVFSAISWSEKSAGIRHILDTLGLRPHNAVFIDDNFHNRAEVAHALPELDVRDVDFIDELLTTPRIKPGKSRVEQYRIVAKRALSMKSAESNTDFLRASHIQATITPIDDLERAAEMVERTNQLNFTKKRQNANALNAIVNDPNFECAFVRVRDDWGDYGVVGFYAYHKTRHELRHFLFSCRILGLGVEKFVYNRLGRPQIKIVGEVVETLDDATIDWVEVVDEFAPTQNAVAAPEHVPSADIVFRGGCDLAPVTELLRAQGYKVHEDNGNHCNQTQLSYLVDAKTLSAEDRARFASQAPFIVPETYASQLLDTVRHVAVISLVVDYSRDFYRDRVTGARLYREISSGLDKRGISGQADNFFYLKRDYDRGGLVSPEEFRATLEAFDRLYPHLERIVFVNGAEIEGVKLSNHHKALNVVLDGFLAERTGNRYRLVDVRTIAKDKSALREPDNIRHYVRPVYVDLFKAIAGALADLP